MPVPTSQGNIFYELPFMVSIVSIENRTPEQMISEIESQHRQAGLNYFAVSMPIQPQGREPMLKIEKYVSRIRSLLACPKNPELKIGILLQQTLGHNAVWNPNFDRELDWERTVRNTGETSVRFCPTGKEFRQYISDAVRLLAQEKPAFLIVDDDARLDIRADNGTFECFCPGHTSLFNQRYGTAYTPEEFREVVNSAGEHDPLLWKFIEFTSDIMNDYMTLLRQSADRGAPGIPMLLCGNSGNSGQNGKWTETLSGGHQPPMFRVGNGSYMENAPRAITQRFASTAAQQILMPPGVLLLDEADTCPHNCYSKSARTMHLHITAGLLNGLDGAKLWITDMYHPNPGITAPYAAILGRYRRFYPALYQALREISWKGPVVNIPRPEALPYPNLPKWWRHGMWITSYLSVFGLPFRFGPTGTCGVHLLSGNDPDAFSDSEIDTMLSEAALIDSAAAKKLVARGFAEAMGIEEIQPLTLPVRDEKIADTGRVLRGSRKCDSLLCPLPGAQVLTGLLSSSGEILFPGAIRNKNVIVTSWRVDWDCRIDLNPDRKELLTYLLRCLPGTELARFLSNSDATFWYGHGKHYDLMAAVNYGFDPLEELLFELPQQPESIQQLLPDGSWEDVAFSEKKGVFHVQSKLDCAEIAVFKLNAVR